MATNPISGDEGKWTPRSIFDIDLGNIPLPQKSIFSQSGDGVDVEKAQESLAQGSSSFFNNFFDKIEDSVTEQVGPTYDAIAETQRRQQELADEVARSRAEVQGIVISQDELVTQMDEVSPAAQAALEAAEEAGRIADKLSNEVSMAAKRLGTNGSLLGYRDLTRSDVAAGKTVPYIPAWTTAGWEATNQKHNAYQVWSGPVENKYEAAGTTYASVVKNQPYLVRFWARADSPGSTLTMRFITDKGHVGGIIRSEKVAKGRSLDGSVEYYPEASVSPLAFIDGLVLNTEWTDHRSIIYFTGSTEAVAVRGTVWNPNPNNDPDSTARQYIAGFEISPYAPSQADVDNAQNLAIQASLELATQALQLATLNAEFNKEQVRLNMMIQRQIDVQSDMLEIQKIQAPRRYSWKAGTGTKAANPYTDDGSTSMHDADLFRCWDYKRKFVFAAKGKWEGSVKIGLNWTNGAYDEYVFTLDFQSPRAISTWGGNAVIDIRRITIEILATDLRRTYTFKETDNEAIISGFIREGDGHMISSIRYVAGEGGEGRFFFRFKAPVMLTTETYGATVPQVDLNNSVIHEASRGHVKHGYEFEISKEIINRCGGAITFEENLGTHNPYDYVSFGELATDSFKDLGEA